MNSFYDFLFLGFSTNIIISCILTINAHNSIAGLIALIFAFINTTCLFFLMELEFVGLLILIVYIGAISVLFLFSVMLFNLKEVVKSKNNNLILKSFFFIILIFTFIFILIQSSLFFEKVVISLDLLSIYELTYWQTEIIFTAFDKQNEILNYIVMYYNDLQYNFTNNQNLYNFFIPNINSELFILGQILYDFYIIYLILTGIILLIGMLGAITLINNSKTFLQYQHNSKQITTNLKNRTSTFL